MTEANATTHRSPTTTRPSSARCANVSVPTLMMSMVHLSGDMGWVRGAIKPGPPGLNGVQGDLSEADQATVRAAVLEIDQGLPRPRFDAPATTLGRRRPGDDVGTRRRAGRRRPRRDDLRGSAATSSRPGWTRAGFPAGGPRGVHVCVIGCGESGLLAGIRLSRAGIPFTILEKNAGVGGTWFENSLSGRGSTSRTTSTRTRSSRARGRTSTRSSPRSTPTSKT